jgi:hypothetical protein
VRTNYGLFGRGRVVSSEGSEMMRKEVYATTDPSMTVRVFWGWDYTPEDADRNSFAAIGRKACQWDVI